MQMVAQSLIMFKLGHNLITILNLMTGRVPGYQ